MERAFASPSPRSSAIGRLIRERCVRLEVVMWVVGTTFVQRRSHI